MCGKCWGRGRDEGIKKPQVEALDMKKLSIFLVCGLTAATYAQTSLKTFTGPDGAFRFQYSDILVNCIPAQKAASSTESDTSAINSQPPVLSAPESCLPQGSFCSGPGSDARPLACFAYPKERFKDKPLFVSATFFVSEIQNARSENMCLKGSSNWLVIKAEEQPTTINHTRFKTFEIGDNWTGGGQDGPVYRAFHHNKCYELGIQTFTSRGEYDPGTFKEFTKQDWSEVDSRLEQALHSFVFLK
jgi:hypothetical protein